MTTIYSIGHSRHAAEHFVALLRAPEIALLVDVRSHPASKWAPQFGKAAARLGSIGRDQILDVLPESLGDVSEFPFHLEV
jgi:hypothetical protein